MVSLVPVPEDESSSSHEGQVTPDLYHSSVSFMVVSHDVSAICFQIIPVSSIAEGSICAVLTIAHLVVPRLIDVEDDGSVAGDG